MDIFQISVPMFEPDVLYIEDVWSHSDSALHSFKGHIGHTSYKTKLSITWDHISQSKQTCSLYQIKLKASKDT